MIECVKAARDSHRALLATCGVFLLTLMVVGPDEVDKAITFLGVTLPNFYVFTFMVGVALWITSLQVCAYLSRARKACREEQCDQKIDNFPWILLWTDGRFATTVNVIEWLVLMSVGSEVSRRLTEVLWPIGWLYGLSFTFLLAAIYYQKSALVSRSDDFWNWMLIAGKVSDRNL